MNTMLSVRMSPEMMSQTEIVAKERGYLSVQEYIRETVRRDIERQQKAELDAIIASARNVKPRHLTIEERNRLAREPLTQKEQEMLRRWEALAGTRKKGSR